MSSSASVAVTEATEVTPELLEAFDRLVPQLSSSNPPPDKQQLAAIVTSRSTQLLIARHQDSGQIVGSLSLVLFRIPTGLRAWIEDVVVDGDARGQGVGEALNLDAIDRARQAGASTVDLTSRPKREVANRLYQRLGFEQRDTNVYRFQL